MNRTSGQAAPPIPLIPPTPLRTRPPMTTSALPKTPRSNRRAAAAAECGSRRRHIDPTTCEREYRPDELEFMQAVERYKLRSGRMFPTYSELLEVVRSLGYERVAAT